jgi:hypothetical protein
MDEKTVVAYIAHRLEAAGGTGKEFTSGASKAIYQATQGVPRLVNQLCEFAMMYAWSDEAKVVSLRVVKSVLKDGVFFGGLSLEREEKDESDLLFLHARDRVVPEGRTG